MKNSKNWRTTIILILMIFFGAAITSRLFFLQIIQRKLLQSQALGQQMGISQITGSRGQIFCQNSQESRGAGEEGEIKSLAINKDSWTVAAMLDQITDKDVFADTLSKNIDMSKEQILGQMNLAENYAVIERDLSSEEINKLKALNLKGLTWENNPERYYPQEELSSQVLGFLGGAGEGQYGIEGHYEDVLKGKTGIEEEKRGLDAIFAEEKESLDGSDIYLTIDYNIQLQAEQLLKKAKEKLDIEAGQIIVLKPDTGKILALANYPNFNPNEYGKQNDLEIFQNSATQKLFEPGSIMKPFAMAAAINEGKVTPDTKYEDKGILHYGTKSIHNYANEKFGETDMTNVLVNSINTGAVFAEQQVGNKMFWNYIDRFGFIEKTGIDLQGESYSKNEGLRNGPDMNYATASFGQGIELTPLQIARGFCVLANGGKLVKPYIVEKIVNGNDVVYTKPEISEPIISQQTTSQITQMLIKVIDVGLPRVGKIPGYYFAGKTGTAQVPLKNGKGYEANKTIQSFVGYGPALNPQFVAMIKLDNPRASKSSLSSVPVFKELAQYIINYWKIPPDYDVNAQEKK